MAQRIVIIQGHPDPRRGHFGHALAEGAKQAGHELKLIEVAQLDFLILRGQGRLGRAAQRLQAQQGIAWANHLVILHPLWLGAMPALLRRFLEQAPRPGFAFEYGSAGMPRKLLTGKSARIVVTMGMPAFIYRWYFRAHGLKTLEPNILGFVGIRPIRASLIGMVEAKNTTREKWLERMRAFGRAGG